jgi:hypothetical protein
MDGGGSEVSSHSNMCVAGIFPGPLYRGGPRVIGVNLVAMSVSEFYLITYPILMCSHG